MVSRTAVEPNKNGVLKTELQSSIAKLEEVWEGEVRFWVEGLVGLVDEQSDRKIGDFSIHRVFSCFTIVKFQYISISLAVFDVTDLFRRG